MPAAIHPMMATPGDKPFDDPAWLFEIKWDGYRAAAFLEQGKVRLVSRNQNDLTGRFPELHDLPQLVNGKTAILDGEVVALDETGRSSFSLMQQRTGIGRHGRQGPTAPEIDDPILRLRPDLPRRIRLCAGFPWSSARSCSPSIIPPEALLRYSDHFRERHLAIRRRQATRAGRNSGQTPRQSLPGTPQPGLAQDQDYANCRLRHRRVHRPGRRPRNFGALVLGLYDQKSSWSTWAKPAQDSIRRNFRRSRSCSRSWRRNAIRSTARWMRTTSTG